MEVEVYEGVVKVKTADGTKILKAGEIFSTGSKEEKTATIVSSATRIEEIIRNHQVQPQSVQILFQDALGDPIPNGVVSCGTESFNFRHGKITIPKPNTDELLLQVRADGYQQIDQKISFVSSSIQIVEMEYLTDYEIQVLNQNKETPVPNALVKIWKAESAERPVKNEGSIIVGSNHPPLHFKKQDQDIVFTEVASVDSFMINIHHDGRAVPTKGDKLLNLGSCSWYPNTPPSLIPGGDPADWWQNSHPYYPVKKSYSSRLRIWDTLCVLNKNSLNSKYIIQGKLEFIRDQRIGYSLLRIPEFTKEDVPLAELQANSDGMVTFKDLHPALYYIQAIDQNRASKILPLHPCYGGGKLFLSDTSKVHVIVIKKGLENKSINLPTVKNAQVTLKSPSGSGLFSLTTEPHGVANFVQIPIGIYELLITSSDGNDEKQVEINKPEEWFYIYLEDWEQYSISGKVYDSQTGEAINGYQLHLNSANEKMIVSNTTSSQEGEYVFNNIPPGSYVITGKTNSLDDLKYFPDGNYAIDGRGVFSHEGIFLLPGKFNKLARPVHVEHQDIEDIDFPLVKVVKTHFSGIVTYQDNKPVENCVLSISAGFKNNPNSMQLVQTVPDVPKTNQQGHFTFYIMNDFVSSPDYPLEFKIVALVGNELPEQWVTEDDNSTFYRYEGKHYVMEQVGSVSVIGGSGNIYENLHIMITNVATGTVYGKIIAEETDFEELEINAIQNNYGLKIDKNNDGTFQIENVAYGDLRINLLPHFKETITAQFGKCTYFKYLFESIDVILTEDQQEIELEIPLRKAGYLGGMVIDAQNNPVGHLYMEVIETTNEHKYISNGYTDNNGYFFLNSPRMNPNLQYYLKIYSEHSNKEIYRSSALKLNQEELIVQLTQ